MRGNAQSMKLRIQPTLPVWLLALSIALPVIASAQAERTLLGTHGNWAAFELRYGELRLCLCGNPGGRIACSA